MTVLRNFSEIQYVWYARLRSSYIHQCTPIILCHHTIHEASVEICKWGMIRSRETEEWNFQKQVTFAIPRFPKLLSTTSFMDMPNVWHPAAYQQVCVAWHYMSSSGWPSCLDTFSVEGSCLFSPALDSGQAHDCFLQWNMVEVMLCMPITELIFKTTGAFCPVSWDLWAAM